MATENIICFERLTQEFDTLFDYNFQEGSKLKLLNINIIQRKYMASVLTKHITSWKISFKNIGKKKDEVKFQQYQFPIDTSFEQTLFMAKPIIGEDLKNWEKHGASLNHWVVGLMHITVQTRYDIQYITMQLSGYMNVPAELAFPPLKHGM